MLNRLPLELVGHIVRLTVPASFCPTTYRDRQQELSRLCLVSKTLCAIAQPVLLEKVQLETDRALDLFLTAVESPEVGVLVKHLRLYVEQHYVEEWETGRTTFDGQKVRALVKRCPSVEGFLLDAGWETTVDLVYLTRWQNLTSLVVGASLISSRPFVLSSLRELSIDLARNGTADSGPLFTPSSVPRLRAFHHTYSRNPFFSLISPELLSQLEVTSYVCGTYELDPDFTPQKAPPDLLLNLSLTDPHAGVTNDKVRPWLSKARYLRLVWVAGAVRVYETAWTRNFYVSTVARDLQHFVTMLISNKIQHLQSLFLPILLNVNFDNHTIHPNLSTAMSNLLSTCKSRNIEVVFEGPAHHEHVSLVSHEFWRRRVKEIEAEQNGGKRA